MEGQLEGQVTPKLSDEKMALLRKIPFLQPLTGVAQIQAWSPRGAPPPSITHTSSPGWHCQGPRLAVLDFCHALPL